ncbi:hypothetical protein [Sphingomonas beigongshangi]|uniref:hypothetical protein n=1 Tax=Sphingomonas beigongshangi TaxID=2782540 RepID=UPI001AED2DCE|nr:hypothetical protein [Sphingomonas beigongshangi]
MMANLGKVALGLVSAALAMPAQATPQAQEAALPAHSDIAVTLDQDLSSAGAHVGQRFGVTVSRDVYADGRLLIPQGTPGVGEVAVRSGKGAYGRSGKLEIALRSVEVEGRSIPVTGRFRAEGDGATAATIGAVAFGGIVAGAFVKGKHARFAAGQEFHAFTVDRVAMRGVAPRLPVMVAAPMRIAPVETAAFVPVAVPQTSYQSLLLAQQGVRGRSAQGWTISD